MYDCKYFIAGLGLVLLCAVFENVGQLGYLNKAWLAGLFAYHHNFFVIVNHVSVYIAIPARLNSPTSFCIVYLYTICIFVCSHDV